MRHRETQIRAFGLFVGEFSKDPQRLLMVAEPDVGVRTGRAKRAIRRVDLEKPLRLLERSSVLVAQRQHQDVVVAGRVVVGGKHQNALEQKLRVVEHVELHADLREQPHGLNVIAVRLQKRPHDALRSVEIALGHEIGRGNDRGRQFRDLGRLLRGVLGLRAVSGRPMEFGESLPTRGQRAMQGDGLAVSLDGRGGFTYSPVAMAAFLEQAPILGMKPLEACQRPECIGYTAEAALTDREHVEHVPVLRHFAVQRLGRRERLRESLRFEQRAHAIHAGLDPRRGRLEFRGLHDGSAGYCPPNL